MSSSPAIEIALPDLPARPGARRPEFPVHRITVNDYLRQIDEGYYKGSRVELWEGWVVDRMTHGSLASSVIMILSELLRELIDREHSLRIQLPLICGESCPEPDLAIVRGQPGHYRRRHPEATEAQIVIEVSDSTLVDDRRYKQRIYANAGVAEYWIVNCSDRQIEVFTLPTGAADEPKYGQCQIVKVDDLVTLTLKGQVLGTIAVAQLFD